MTIELKDVPKTDKASPALDPVTADPISGEFLYQEGYPGRVELIGGQIVALSPTGRLHGRIEGNTYFVLSQHVREKKLGEVLVGETGIYTARDPDTVRGMDVAFVSYERLADAKSESFLDVAPELIVEIMSPSDRWVDVLAKLEEYIAIGVQVVWVIDPSNQQIYVYRSMTDVTILTAADELTGEPALPDFRVPVATLFEG